MAAAGEALAREEAGRGEMGLIMKWPSRAAAVEGFRERHGMDAAAVVSTPCFEGMGKLLGMRVAKSGEEGAEEDLAAKLAAAEGLLAGGSEFVFVHSKHADEAAHTGDPGAKVDAIEGFDRALASFPRLFDDPELLTVVTSDHSTPTTRDPRVIHGGDPVPVLFHGVTVRRDGTCAFDEVSAAAGGMGQILGRDLMPLVLYLSRRAPFYTGGI
jgi:2,3-bisphosphoglycerate-independent phosphoglycerate mutase